MHITIKVVELTAMGLTFHKIFKNQKIDLWNYKIVSNINVRDIKTGLGWSLKLSSGDIGLRSWPRKYYIFMVLETSCLKIIMWAP